MSNRIIDEQVVKMEFDNKNFEKNAQTSLKTIDKLKASLKFDNAEKGFQRIDNAANKINFNKLENGVQSLTNRFSILGTIGGRIVENITDSFMGGMGKLTKLLAAPINQMIEGGKNRAMNIAQAQFSLKGQGIDWKKESEEYKITLEHMTAEEQDALEKSGQFLDSLYKDIDYAVAGTAYGLDSAAKAAAQLSAAGVDIGDDMRIALRGISGVAAMTNTSYDEISRIFLHVAGKNKLQLEELNMISERGLGVSEKLAEYIGVSGAELSDMVSKGKIDFATFAACMDDAFGEHAKDANSTFTGAMANVKAALSKIGADVAGPAFDAMIKPLNDVRKILNNIRSALQPLFKDVSFAIDLLSKYVSAFLGLSGLVTDKTLGIDQMPRLTAAINNLEMAFVMLFYAASNVIKPIREAFFEVFKPSGDIIVDITSGIAAFAFQIMQASESASGLKPIFKTVFTVIKSIMDVIGSLGDALGKILMSLGDLVPLLLDLVATVADAIAQFIDWINTSGLLDTALDGLSTALTFVITVLKEFVDIIIQGATKFGTWIEGFEGINPPMIDFSKGLEGIVEFANDAFKSIGDFFTSLFKGKEVVEDTNDEIEEMAGVLGERFGPELDDQSEKVTAAGNAVKSFGTIFDIVKEQVINAIDAMGKALNMSQIFNAKNARTFIDTWLNTLKTLTKTASKSLKETDFGAILKNSFDGFLKFFGMEKGEIDWNRFFKVAQFGIAVGIIFKLIDLLKSFKKGIDTLTGVVRSIAGSFVSLAASVREYVKGENFLKRTKGFENIAKGILILAVAIAGLAAITHLKDANGNGVTFADLWHAAGMIAALTAVVALILLGYEKLKQIIVGADDGEDEDGPSEVIDRILGTFENIAESFAQSMMFVGIGITIAALTASMLIVAEAFRQWDEILHDTNRSASEIGETIAALAITFIVIVLATAALLALVHDAKQSSLGIALTIAALVAGVWALLYAIDSFKDIKWDEYKETIILVGAFFAALAVAIGLISHFSNSGEGGDWEALSAGGGIAAGLIGFAEAIKKLKDMHFLEILSGFYPILLMLVSIVGAIILITSVATPLTVGSAIGLVALMGALANTLSAAVTAITALTALDAAKQLQAFIEVLGLLLAIGGAMYLMGKGGATAAPIFSMAVLIVVLCGALSWIAMMDWKDVLKGIGFLGAALYAVGKALSLSGLNVFNAAKVWATAGLIVATGIALAVLTRIEWYKVLVAIGELSLALFAVANIINTLKYGFSNFRNILSFAVVIVATAIAIAGLALLPMKQTAVATLELCSALIAIGFALKLANGFSIGSWKTNLLPMAIVIGAFIAELGIIIGLLAAFTDTDKALKAAEALAICMVALAALVGAVIGFMKIAGPISADLGPTIAVLVVCGVIIAGLAGVVHILSAVPNPEGAIKAAEALILLCAALAGLMFAVGMVGAVILAMNVSILAAIGVGLLVAAAVVALGVLITAIIVALGMVIKYIDLGIKEIFGKDANTLETILTYVDTGFAVINRIIEKIGEGIGLAYGVAVKTFTAEVVQGIHDAMTNVSEVVKEFDSLRDIFKGWQNEKVDVTTFTKAMSDIVVAMQGLVALSVEMKALSGELVENVGMMAIGGAGSIVSHEAGKAAGGLLGQAANKIKEMIGGKGAASEVASANSDAKSSESEFKDLIKTAEVCVTVLKTFNDKLKGYTFDVNALKGATEAAKLIREFCGAMRDYVGLEQQNIGQYGDTQMGATLQSTLENFANAIMAFNNKLKGYSFDKTALDTAIDYLDRLKDLCKEFPALMSASAGSNSIGDKVSGFSNFIKGLADSLIYFDECMAKVGQDNVEIGLTLLQSFADVFNDVAQKIPGIFEMVASGTENKVGGASGFAAMVSSLGTALSSFSTNIKDVNTVHIQAVLAVLDDLYTFLDKLSTHGDFSNNFGEALSSLGKYTKDGNIFSGFDTQKIGEDIKKSFTKILNGLANADYTSYYAKMYKIGERLIFKMRDGIKGELSTNALKHGFFNALNTAMMTLMIEGEIVAKFNKFGENIIKFINDGIRLPQTVTGMAQAFWQTIGQGATNALNQLIPGLITVGQRIASYIAQGINSPQSISIIASAMQSAVNAAAAGIRATIGIDIDVNAEVSGGAADFEDAVDVYDEKGNKLKSAITSSYDGATDADNKGSAKFAGAKLANGKRNARAIRLAYDDSWRASQEGGKRVTEAEEKTLGSMYENDSRFNQATKEHTASITQNWDYALGELGKYFSKGQSWDQTITNIQNKVGGDLNLSTELIAQGLSNMFHIPLNEAQQMAEDIKKGTDDVAGAITDGANKVAGGAGGGGGGGGAAGGFVASYSEFWQNLYLINHQGINAFEQQFETFEQWQENTLKKTQEIIDNYKNAVVDAKKKAAEGLFSEVPEPKEDVTKEKLKKNLQDQVNQIKEFNNIILQLRTRLMGTNLFDAITEMGVDSIDELRALNSMTNEELSEYASLYDQKYVASFQTIQQKAQSELQNLYGGMQINIDQFAATFDGSLKSVEGYFAGQAEAIKAAGASVGTNLTAGVAEGVTSPEAKEALQTGLQGMADAIHAGEGDGIADAVCGISSPAELTKEIGKYLVMGVAEGMKDPEAQQSLVDAMTQVMQAFLDAIGGTNSDSGIGVQMQTLGTTITQSITEALTNIEIMGQNFYNSGVDLMTKFVEGFKSQQSIAQANINIILTDISNNIKGIANITKFKTAGTELFKGLMKGFETGWTGAGEKGGGNGEKSYGKTVIDKVMKGIFKILKEYKGGGDSKSKSSTFYKIGQEFIKGLIKGLESKQGELYAAVERIVKEAIAHAKAAAAVASPSKKTAEIGMYMGMGLVNGLMSMSGAVSEASSSITEEALQGFRDISNVLGGLEDFDATPVIAPIMDLTGIQNGVSEMGNMLDRNSTFEMAASINSGLEAQRTAKLNEMTDLRRAMDSVYSSNASRSTEMAQLQAAVATLNSSINNQTAPDYAPLQSAINGLNSSLANRSAGDTLNLNNTFNITSNDPEAVAEEVNNALQQMIDRRAAVWA